MTGMSKKTETPVYLGAAYKSFETKNLISPSDSGELVLHKKAAIKLAL